MTSGRARGAFGSREEDEVDLVSPVGVSSGIAREESEIRSS